MGRPRMYTPESLWGHFEDYIADTDANPWVRKVPIKSGPLAGTVMDVDCQRPYSLDGFQSYLITNGISSSGFKKYRHNEGGAYEDFRGVIARMREICKAQRTEGAALGFFNPSVVAWDIGQGKLARKDDKQVEPTKLIVEVEGRIPKDQEGAIKEV